MTFRPACMAAVLLLSLSWQAVAAPRVGRTTAPDESSTAKDPKRVLAQLVSKHATESGLNRELGSYSLSPELVQLRRYAEPGQKQIKVVCIVSIALKDSRDVLVAEVRGTASAVGGGAFDALDAASRAAVMRVPSALAKLRGVNDSEIARR